MVCSDFEGLREDRRHEKDLKFLDFLASSVLTLVQPSSFIISYRGLTFFILISFRGYTSLLKTPK